MSHDKHLKHLSSPGPSIGDCNILSITFGTEMQNLNSYHNQLAVRGSSWKYDPMLSGSFN